MNRRAQSGSSPLKMTIDATCPWNTVCRMASENSFPASRRFSRPDATSLPPSRQQPTPTRALFMKTTLLSTLFAFAILITIPLRANEAGELLEKLQVEATKNLDAIKGEKGVTRYEIERIGNELVRLQKDLARDTFNAQDAERALTQLASTRISPEAKVLVSRISALLPGLAEANEKETVARLNASLEKAAAACLSAKKDTDLDEVAAELNARQRRPVDYSSSAGRTRNYARLDAAIRHVGRWQEYLAQAAGGYEVPAKNILRELAENPTSYPLLTRTQILARIGPEETAETPDVLLRAVTNLDDLPPVITRLTRTVAPRRFGSSPYADSSLIVAELNQIYKAHAAFKAGSYSQAIQIGTAAQYDGGSAMPSVETIRLRGLLLAEVLPRYLEVSGHGDMKASENPSQYLMRLADEATAKGDWDMVQRVLDAYRLSAFGMRAPAWLQGAITACAAFVSGQNFEKAGQFSHAVLSYQAVLRQAGKHVPLKEAGERLAAISKEHPQAFNAAKENELRGPESAAPPRPRPVTAP